MKTLITSFISLVLFINTAFAQNDLLKDIPAWMAENHVPCVGVGVITNGKISWIKNFGELQSGHPAPENTLFNIA